MPIGRNLTGGQDDKGIENRKEDAPFNSPIFSHCPPRPSCLSAGSLELPHGLRFEQQKFPPVT